MANEWLQRLLGVARKELPVAEGALARELTPLEREAAGLPATITKEGEVLGEGVSSFKPKTAKTIDIEPVPTPPEAYPSPGGANLDNSLAVDSLDPQDVVSKWQRLKTMAPYAAAAGAGTYFGAKSAMDGGDGQAASASQVPGSPEAAPVATAIPKAEQKTAEESEIENQIKQLSRPSVTERNSASKVTPIEFGDSNIAQLQKLQELYKQMNDAQQTNELGRIGAAMATGMSGVENPYDAISQDRAKRIAQMPEQYIKEVEFQKDDPNSAVSQGMRSFFATQGFPVSGSASARQLEKMEPQVANIYNQREAGVLRKDLARENRESRLQEMQMRLASAKDMKKQAKDDKDDKFIQSLRKETTTGPLGKMSSNYHTAMRMTDSLAQFAKDPSGYSDYATLMGGLKSLQGDDSVVKEAEIRLGMNAASLGDKVKNWADHLITGRSLRPEQRAEMIKTVRILSETARRQYRDAIQPILRQAQEVGIDPKLIINEETVAPNQDMDTFKKQTKNALKEAVKNPGGNMIMVRTKDGKTWNIPKEKLNDALSRGAVEVK